MDKNTALKLFTYNEKTGDLLWGCNRQGHTKKGDIVGTIQTNKSGKRYRAARVNQRHFLVHRLVWLFNYGEFPSCCIDHIDGNGLNNKLSNLREVTRQQNQQNQKISSRSKTGIMGVSFDRKSGKFVARIGSRKNQKNLGYFFDLFEAACVRKSAELKAGYHENHGQARSL